MEEKEREGKEREGEEREGEEREGEKGGREEVWEGRKREMEKRKKGKGEGDRKEISYTAEVLAELTIDHSLTDLDFDIHVTRCHQHVKQILL